MKLYPAPGQGLKGVAVRLDVAPSRAAHSQDVGQGAA
ncbi:hypothetical protein ABIC08_003819 [Bradyrhizobium sp. RT9b]